MAAPPEDMSNLAYLLSLARTTFPRLYSLPLPVHPQYGSPHVYTHLKALCGPSVPEHIRLEASSKDIRTALQRSDSESGYSKMVSLLAAARSHARPSTSDNLSDTEVTMQELLANPSKSTELRMDVGHLSTYALRHTPDLPAALMEMQDGARVYVWKVLALLYPRLSQASIERVVKSLTVEGEHALGDLLLVTTLSRFAFDSMRREFHIHVGVRYFGNVLELANEREPADIEKYRASVVGALLRSGHAYTELRLGTLFYYVRQRHPRQTTKVYFGCASTFAPSPRCRASCRSTAETTVSSTTRWPTSPMPTTILSRR